MDFDANQLFYISPFRFEIRLNQFQLKQPEKLLNLSNKDSSKELLYHDKILRPKKIVTIYANI